MEVSYWQTLKRFGYLPEIDVLLDWRNRLSEKKNQGVFNPEWYDREIEAVDILLSLHQ